MDGRRVLLKKDLNLGVPKLIRQKGLIEPAKKILDDGGTNLDLMAKGYAPIGADGYRIEIHHLLGKEPGPVVEIERTLHQKETKILHNMIEGSFRNNKEKRKSWNRFRENYWKRRAKISNNI
ncbi:HNH/ENDO VII family nuclease [Marinagarivorans algicola]|uniref:HNH/ENDO VII family nuclease n=1 Tax=Marinagarivorans algicola TaxID=1513270 RepID=UPI0006B65BC0|nr:HNH/ENDO VII family nuclease [Marinagarivorans algicola]